MTTDIRTRVAALAAAATILLLSIVGASSYVALVNATRQSQLDLLEERLDNLEQRLVAGDELSPRLQLDLSLRVIRAGEDLPGTRPGTLQVVRPSDDPEILALVGRVSTIQIDRTLATLRIGLWISVLMIGLLVGGTTWLVVDRALSPVRRLTERARAIEANQSTELLPVTGSGDEIAELATTFNTMLRKLRLSDSERRRFVSDASHELRTPLMVLTADTEYARDHGTDAAELARSVLDQSTRLTALVDDLLTLASIDEGQTTADQVLTVGNVLTEAGAADHAGELDRHLSAIRIPDVSRSVSNIVANAERHKAAMLDLSASASGDTVTITVDDDGPGVPAEERTEIFKRFYRPDGGRTRVEGGAGLGLAIAKAEIGLAGGTISVDDSPLGGARFSITVPIVA